MPDTILTFADFADETTEFLSLPRRSSTPLHTHRRATDYAGYLSEWHQRFQGSPLPPKPTGDLPAAEAFVNCGRWVWRCVCGAALSVEPGEDLICVRCGLGGWRSVVFPTQKAEIETQLLSLPGHRQNAPLRQWSTAWSVDDLRTRVAKADALIGEGIEFPRALSIGATRVWVTGEILTAANMNTFVSQILDDLAGRNGLIELEDSLSLPAGDSALVLPGGTTGQRPSSPSAGMVRFNTTLDEMDLYRGSVHGWTQIPTDAVTFAQLLSAGLVGNMADQMAVGNHGHSIDVEATAFPVNGFRTFHKGSGSSYVILSDSISLTKISLTPSTTSEQVFVGFRIRQLDQSLTWNFRIQRAIGGTGLTAADYTTTVGNVVTADGAASTAVVVAVDRPNTTSEVHYHVFGYHGGTGTDTIEVGGLGAVISLSTS